MGHVDRRDPEVLLDAADLLPHGHAQLGVQIGQGLVHEQDLRRDHERPGECNALLLAARELAREPLFEPVKAHAPDDIPDARIHLPVGNLADPEPVGDVLPDVEVGEERVVLEDHPRLAPVRGNVVHEPLAEVHLPLVGRVEAGDDAQQCRLAAAAGAQEREEVPVLDLKAHPVDGPQLPEDLADPLQDDLHAGPISTG